MRAGWHHRLDGCEFEWTPGVGDGQGGLACCNSWGLKELDTTEWLNWLNDWYLSYFNYQNQDRKYGTPLPPTWYQFSCLYQPNLHHIIIILLWFFSLRSILIRGLKRFFCIWCNSAYQSHTKFYIIILFQCLWVILYFFLFTYTLLPWCMSNGNLGGGEWYISVISWDIVCHLYMWITWKDREFLFTKYFALLNALSLCFNIWCCRVEIWVQPDFIHSFVLLIFQIWQLVFILYYW